MKSQRNKLPPRPGVYLFRDKDNHLLYVGKAKSLKKRVASYFQKKENLTPDKKLMLSKIKNLDHIVVDNETEALLLEHNLIKKYRPRYNVVFKDDKSYVYIKITQEDFPRVFIDRERKIKSSRASKIEKIFGPYTSAESTRLTLKILRQIFPFRSCKTMPKKPCLFYHINLCPAPCIKKISQNDYQEAIKEIVRFLKGQWEQILEETKKKMERESQKQNYEKAAILRNRLLALEKIREKQKVITTQKLNQDIISLVQTENKAAVNLFIIREGRLLGKENFLLRHTKSKSTKEILESFIKEYYLTPQNRPPELIVPVPISYPFSPSLKIIVPQKGKKKRLIALGKINAQQFLDSIKEGQKKQKSQDLKTLTELTSYLKLQKIPKRIEAYDISNIQGQEATGSMIVFQNGKPDKDRYRRFKIKSVSGANDVTMMQEILQRRFRHHNWSLPNLVIVDGGKAQLNIALKVLPKNKIAIPVRALAKKWEEIYFPKIKNPTTLPPTSQSLMLIKRIRDEAHRFAIAYHHKLRSKEALASQLDKIPGIGSQKKKLLLAKLGSLEKIKKAKLEELEKILGKKTASRVKNKLK